SALGRAPCHPDQHRPLPDRTPPAAAPRRLPSQPGGACPHGTRHARTLPEGHLPPAPPEALTAPMTDYPNGLRTFGGAVAIITGGASGVGRALAEALADPAVE